MKEMDPYVHHLAQAGIRAERDRRIIERHERWREQALGFLRQIIDGRGCEDEWPALAEFIERSESGASSEKAPAKCGELVEGHPCQSDAGHEGACRHLHSTRETPMAAKQGNWPVNTKLRAQIDELLNEIDHLRGLLTQAPIAKVTIRESGAGHYAPDDVSVSLYAPGLPPGEHDLYLMPEYSPATSTGDQSK